MTLTVCVCRGGGGLYREVLPRQSDAGFSVPDEVLRLLARAGVDRAVVALHHFHFCGHLDGVCMFSVCASVVRVSRAIVPMPLPVLQDSGACA